MTPLTDNPKIIVRIDENGLVAEVSTNISPQVAVTVVHGFPAYADNKQCYNLNKMKDSATFTG